MNEADLIKLRQLTERAAYFRGLREGVKRFAWWIGDTQFVGGNSAITPLRDALEEIDKEEHIDAVKMGEKDAKVKNDRN